MSNNFDVKSKNFDVKSNNELFKQALVEGVNRRIDRDIEEKQIEEMAKVIAEATKYAGKILVEETKSFVKENHRYHSKNDFDKAHEKSMSELEAEHLYNAGYRKQSENTVELHCKVGDTVYHTDGIRIYELEIFDISLRKNKPYYETESIDFDNDAIGKSIFLSKEEAEAKMKGGEE